MLRIVLILALSLACSLLLAQTTKTSATSSPKPFVLGRIDELDSKILSEKRILNIYLPEGYSENDSTRYPVIYLLDGSADEDFIHIVGLVQFNSFEWINQVPKSIVVGIASVDRRRDFTFPSTIASDKKNNPSSGHSGKFIDFLEKELQPYIAKTYHTNTQKTLIGQSLGGLLATEILFNRPALFSSYIIVSPSLWWNNGSLLKQEPTLFNENLKQTTSVYIAVGKEGLTPTAEPRVMEVDANLLFEKLQQSKNTSLKVFFDYLPQENHATILHQAVFNAFRTLYPVREKE